MEPAKSPTETSLSISVSAEYACKKLLVAVKALLHGKNGVDEHKAKQLRKEWETLQAESTLTGNDRTALDKEFEQLRSKIHVQVEHRNQKFSALETHLVDLKLALKADDLNTSQKLEQKIINGLNSIKGLSVPRRQKIISELEAFQPKIKKLSAWRHWSTGKAREKIITEIENLHETEKNLEKVAKRIQQARDEWKQWDQSGEGGDKKLYQKFDAACSKAYEPCKKLFDAKRKQRRACSNTRGEICQLLETQYEETDWREPDWKAIQQALRDQADRWRKAGAAEYRDRKPLQKRYEEIITKYNGPLDRERKQNLRQRTELIVEVQQLASIDDSRKAIAELQSLKKKWQVTVSAGRKQEQAIWQQFTTACDVVYEKSRAAKKEFDQTLINQLQVKQGLCSEIESALALPTEPGPDALGKQIEQWNIRWSESGRAPKSDAKKIDKRFRDAIGNVRKLLKSLNKQKQSEQEQLLFQFAARCEEFEEAVFEYIDDNISAPATPKLVFDSLQSSLADAMGKRFSSTQQAIPSGSGRSKWLDSMDSNYQIINGYLVQLEINAGIGSPAAHNKLRMALQIGRLSAAMGKAAKQELLDTNELINRIHITGAVKPMQQTEINQRFKTCHQAISHE